MAILFSISTNDFDWIYFFDFDKGQGTTQDRGQDKANRDGEIVLQGHKGRDAIG